MTCHRFFQLAITLTTLVIITAGCKKDSAEDPTTTSSAPQSSTVDEEDEIEVAMAELSPADRMIAQAQRSCPVTDQQLGTMGPPIKVTVEGREVFVCCDGCVEELEKNFATYATKLDQPPS